MAYFLRPTSFVSRNAFLSRAAATGQMDIDNGRNYLTQDQVNAILTFLAIYKPVIDLLLPAQAGRSKETREKNLALAILQTHVTDLWAVLKRRINRNGEPNEILTYYGLPLDGKNPVMNTETEWANMAAIVVAGDANAVLAGHTAMTNPSAAEVQAALTSYQSEAGDIAEADRDLDLAQADATALVPQADEMIDDVMDALRYNLRKMSFASQRRIMRTYGAQFYFAPGEPNEGFRSEIFATGDGTTTVFSHTVANPPIMPVTVVLTDGVEIFTDTDNGDGTATLTGTNGGTGTLTYATGVLSVTFNVAPVLGSEIKVEYLEVV